MVDNIGKLRVLCNSGNPKPLSDFITFCTDDDNIQWIIDAAEQGDSNAQFALSEYYLFKENDLHTAELAFSWTMKSAQQGNSWGENNVAYCYRHGLGITQDVGKALEWYKKSASQGNTSGLSNVGYCYENGIGIEKDAVAALQWYLKSAEGGNPNSQNKVGDLYSEGVGTEINPTAAIGWYEKAADNGISDALFSLLQIYWGLKFGRNYRNYQVAAAKLEDFHHTSPDDETVQFFLAFVYYFGIGIRNDKDRAVSVWPALDDILSDEVEIPLGIKEMGFFYIPGSFFICEYDTFKCDCPIINELFLPLMLSYSRAIQKSSYANHHLLMNSKEIYYKRGVRAREFYQLLKKYNQDPWDVLQFASSSINEQLYEYLRNDQEEEFKKLMVNEKSDLMARFRAYSMFRRMVDLPKMVDETNDNETEETLDKSISVITENPGKVNFLRERLMGFSELNEPIDFIDYGIDNVVLLLCTALMYADTGNEASSIINYEDVCSLKKIVEQERYKHLFVFARNYLDEYANDGEELEIEAQEPSFPQEQIIIEEGTTVNPSYPTFLRTGRVRLGFLQDVLSKKYLRQWFSNRIEDVPYIKYVFFGNGIEPKNKMIFSGSKTELTLFVLFLSKGYGKSRIWSYFNQYIVDKNGKPVFAKNARSNVKENYLDAEDRIRQAIIGLIGNKILSKEVEKDLK